MLASLLRSKTPNDRPTIRSPFLPPWNRHGANGQPVDGSERSGEDSDDEGDRYQDGEDGDDDDEDEEDDHDPLLPIFSAEHLDRLPIYNITHSIRLLVIQRCETTLSWDQLRSPQISQFLVKPIQQQIRASHFSRATLYALIANGLQFQKEGQMNPGNIGVSKTRSSICELLAMRLLKEYSTRELIDGLFYDFDPLQGLSAPTPGTATPGAAKHRLARISTIEIAIRAQAKRFLAHPLVVQQLEAVWAGTIVFHSYADYLHRPPAKQPNFRGQDYGTMNPQALRSRRSGSGGRSPVKHSATALESGLRRAVTLYDPRDASLFKLSRLRVPRYRQIFSTCSFAIMLGLFLAVLIEHSLDITALEVVFWFWSAGFMLDEVVGFSEQGFGLYILSVWNAFDLGILVMFVVYYILRLYGIINPDVQKKHVADMAYDVLASTAVLLFPRLFSVLDHYRYFSQLLIAFRMMALDMVAILVLIIIACSGFFVTFTLAFSDNSLNAANAAYALFQMVMGFTPAAWEMWLKYNPLGKGILTLFLFICHFLIVTILITVLTNSFMAVVQNANEEHQYLFAVNTISMVKSDALFSYIAPTNVIGWSLAPMRYCMSFKKFIRLNRTIIKATHLPILFVIFSYERLILSRGRVDATDLVERRGRAHTKPAAFSIRAGSVFSPGARLREPSIATFRKDQALDEVFRRPFPGTLRKVGEEAEAEMTKSTNVVRDWMQGMGHEGGASPPLEQPRSILDRLETRRRPFARRTRTDHRMAAIKRHHSIATRSVASDPDLIHQGSFIPGTIREENEADQQQTDADGDDELVTNDEEESGFDRPTGGSDSDKENRRRQTVDESEEDYFNTPVVVKTQSPAEPSSSSSARQARLLAQAANAGALRPARPHHHRNLSTTTILYSPALGSKQPSRPSSPNKRPQTTARNKGTRSGTATPRRTPARALGVTGVPSLGSSVPAQSIPAPRNRPNSSSSTIDFLAMANLQPDRYQSFNAQALDLASELGDNRHVPDMPPLAASFSTQLEIAAMNPRRFAQQQDHEEQEERGRMNRIMLARMNTLEEGFREMLQEVRALKGPDRRARRPLKKKGSGGARTQTNSNETSDDEETDERTQTSI